MSEIIPGSALPASGPPLPLQGQPAVIAAQVEHMQQAHPAPTVEQRLATGGVTPFNPTTTVRGPRHSMKKGKTPVLAPEEA